MANNRTEKQEKLLKDFYKSKKVAEASVLDKISVLETYLYSQTNCYSFSFENRPMPLEILDDIVLNNLENEFLTRKKALFIQYV